MPCLTGRGTIHRMPSVPYYKGEIKMNSKKQKKMIRIVCFVIAAAMVLGLVATCFLAF